MSAHVAILGGTLSQRHRVAGVTLLGTKNSFSTQGARGGIACCIPVQP